MFHRIEDLYSQPGTGTGVAAYPVGASFIAITVFFLIAFSSNAILSSVTLSRLGITITISSTFFMALIILILFVL
jgi:hypothetical protein